MELALSIVLLAVSPVAVLNGQKADKSLAQRIIGEWEGARHIRAFYADGTPGATAKCQPQRDQNRPDKCRGHVLLGIPDIALRAEIGCAEIWPNDLRDDRFQYFEKLLNAQRTTTASHGAKLGLAPADRIKSSCIG